MEIVFDQILVEWLASGYDSTKATWSRCTDGYRLQSDRSNSIPSLYFLGASFQSFVDRLTALDSQLYGKKEKQDEAFPHDELVEVFTRAPTLETKKRLRAWNVDQKQILFGLRHSKLLDGSVNESRMEKLPLLPCKGLWIERLVPDRAHQYVDIQNLIEPNSSYIANTISQATLRQQNLECAENRLTLSGFEQFLVRLDEKTIGAFATSCHQLPQGRHPESDSHPLQAMALFDLGLVPEVRGRSLGQKIVQHFLHCSRSRNALAVVFAQEELIPFYALLGFETEAEYQRWSNRAQDGKPNQISSP